MTALAEQQILINCQASTWQYKLSKASIKIKTAKRFRRKTKGARVYTLVEVNHLISSMPSYIASQLPNSLRHHLDVFLANNAKKLAPYRYINLAIKL